VRLLPSTNLPETYLINYLGCGGPNSTLSRSSILHRSCPESRGLLYASSTTYKDYGTYDVANYSALRNYNIPTLEARFGWEDVHVGYPKAPEAGDGIGAYQSLIAQITNNAFFWVGVFGLDPRPTNLSGLGGMSNPQQSLFDRLKENSAIPSRSWAYTAGSKYCKFRPLNRPIFQFMKYLNSLISWR
jgi:hypothetical protein